MKRRDFVIAGSSVSLGSTVASNKPSLAIQFEIAKPSDVPINKVNSLYVDFSTIKIVPQSLSRSTSLTLNIKLNVENIGSESVSVDIPVKNTIRRSDISSDLPLVIDGIDTSQEIINGEIEIIALHPDLESNKEFRRKFTLSESLLDKLNLYLPFSEGNGSETSDPINDTKQTINGATWTTNTTVGKYAMKFANVGDYVNVNRSNLDPPATVGAWIYVSQSADQFGKVALKLLDGNDYSVRIDQYEQTGVFGFTEYGVEDYKFSTSTVLDRWFHATWVFDNSETRLYIDGNLSDTNPNVGKLPLSKVGQKLNGRIGEITVYNRRLLEQEIEALAGGNSLLNI
jgi:hypothetical protein